MKHLFDVVHRGFFLIAAILFSLACSITVFPTVAQADMKAFKSMQKQIARDGKLRGGKSYWERAKAVYGRKVTAPVAGIGKTDTVVGEHPINFGKGFTWDRKDEEIVLVMFINAADPLGVSIDGVRKGDRIQVTSAAGIASFTKDEGNPLATSIVGLVAVGAKGAAAAFGAPEAIPVINAAEELAKEQFKATNVKHKRRDAFGVDPGTGHKARQEGGILVSLPAAGGPYYSGKPKKRWLKSHKPRRDKQRPDHVKDAFFLVRNNPFHNSRVLRGNTQIYVVAWDWKFEDNAGFYKVFMRITQSKKPDKPPVVN